MVTAARADGSLDAYRRLREVPGICRANDIMSGFPCCRMRWLFRRTRVKKGQMRDYCRSTAEVRDGSGGSSARSAVAVRWPARVSPGGKPAQHRGPGITACPAGRISPAARPAGARHTAWMPRSRCSYSMGEASTPYPHGTARSGNAPGATPAAGPPPDPGSPARQAGRNEPPGRAVTPGVKDR